MASHVDLESRVAGELPEADLTSCLIRNVDASCVLAVAATFLVLVEKLFGGREIPEEVRVLV